jgi:hypothetical protein
MEILNLKKKYINNIKNHMIKINNKMIKLYELDYTLLNNKNNELINMKGGANLSEQITINEKNKNNILTGINKLKKENSKLKDENQKIFDLSIKQIKCLKDKYTILDNKCDEILNNP